jgi:hypothetical protein
MGMPEKIVFILSTSRTGTKTLAEGLEGGDICSPHQPTHSRFLTVASNYYLHGWLPRKALEWLVTRLREPQILNAGCRYYVQVFSLDYLPAKIISERYPNVYIVHIVRDPRTFVRSYLNWTHTRAKSFVANKLVLGWHPSGCFTGEMPCEEWRRMDEFQRVCWHWTYKNALLERLFGDDEQYLRVRFEDLYFEEEAEELRKMFAFIGIPYQERYESVIRKRKNASRKTYCSSWSNWPIEQQSQLSKICGKKMKSYGYIAVG